MDSNQQKEEIMITYLIGSAFILILSVLGIRSIIKERKHRKRQLAIANTYDRLVKESKLAIEHAEFLSYRYIGLDKRNRKLLLIDHCNREKQELCIPLVEIGESKIIHVKDATQGIKTILLELRNRRSNKPVQFCFFDKDHDPVIELPTLARKAINWKTKVDIHKRPGNVSREAEYVL
jgi:hypothetical protein